MVNSYSLGKYCLRNVSYVLLTFVMASFVQRKLAVFIEMVVYKLETRTGSPKKLVNITWFCQRIGNSLISEYFWNENFVLFIVPLSLLLSFIRIKQIFKASGDIAYYLWWRWYCSFCFSFYAALSCRYN